MELSGSFRHRNSPSKRFLGDWSQPPLENPSTAAVPAAAAAAAAEDVEFDEDDVFWTGDFSESSRRAESPPSSSLSPTVQNRRNPPNRRRSFRQVQNFGILAALPEDVKREEEIGGAGSGGGGGGGERSLLYRKPSFASSTSSESSSSSSRLSTMIQAIPARIQSSNDQEREREREYSQSMPVGEIARSVPIDVPIRARAGKVDLGAKDEDSESEMLPPHEILSRRNRLSGATTFSVLEGAGRTLKGRDLRKVRNAVLQKTGFLD
ncbi:hypothetical protein Scep_003362 [Stephania cephalantha]|uniref:Senescence regulator n=1 Tax=Stephania cephalantha TaxID=152367 RepID=A0AAP0PUC9_9MAGN